MKNKKSYILSLIAALCFLLTYFVTKVTLNFILAIAWFVIGLYYLEEYKKKEKKKWKKYYLYYH